MCELQDVNCAIQRTGVVAANQTTIHKLTLKVSYTKITAYMIWSMQMYLTARAKQTSNGAVKNNFLLPPSVLSKMWLPLSDFSQLD